MGIELTVQEDEGTITHTSPRVTGVELSSGTLTVFFSPKWADTTEKEYNLSDVVTLSVRRDTENDPDYVVD